MTVQEQNLPTQTKLVKHIGINQQHIKKTNKSLQYLYNADQSKLFGDFKWVVITLLINENMSDQQLLKRFPSYNIKSMKQLIAYFFDMDHSGLVQLMRLTRKYHLSTQQRVALAKCLLLLTEKSTDDAYKSIEEIFFKNE